MQDEKDTIYSNCIFDRSNGICTRWTYTLPGPRQHNVVEIMGLLRDIIDRILPPKADIGFFQEWDSKTGKIKNSSTRLFQLCMVGFLFLFTKLIFINVFEAESVSLNTLVFILAFYVLTLTATFAPKQFKNTAEIRGFVEALSKQKEETKP